MENRNRKKYRLVARAAVLLLSLTLTGCGWLKGSSKPADQSLQSGGQSAEAGESQKTDAGADGPAGSAGNGGGSGASGAGDGSGFSMTMLDVGQGLALVIEADGHAMLYDGGGRDSSSYVISYLNRAGLDSFDYMIASHYDEDHIAGLVGCLYNFEFSSIICPDYVTDTDIYTSFEDAEQRSGAEVVHPAAGDTFALGGAEITVVGPQEYGSSLDNNNSIAVRIVYGEFSCLLTGDAEASEESDLVKSGIELQSDLYVAGHHGSSSSTSAVLMRKVKPEVVWISCGVGNDYGHPAAETIRTIEKYGADIYRTDLQGDITCTSDGKTYSFSQSPCEDHSDGAAVSETAGVSRGMDWASGGAGDASAEEEADGPGDSVSTDGANTGDSDSADGANTGDSDSTEQTYILNTHTKKFHLPGCSAAAKMSDKNRKETEATREELIAEGYSPCGNCDP